MDYGIRHDADDRFERFSRNLMRWVLGPGLLSVHVGVYLVTLVALLVWNFARSPSDVWVDGPLRSWGLVVVFHATAVAAGWAAWRLMRMGQTAIAPEAQAGTPRAWPAQAAPTPHLDTHSAAPSRNGTATMTEEWARRWLRESVRIVRDAVSPSAIANGEQSEGHLPRLAASEAAGPGITEWGTLFARRTREMMASARDHLPPALGLANGSASAASSPAPVESPSDPTRTWPGGPETAPGPLTDASRPAGANATWPAPTNGAGHGADAHDAPVHAIGAASPYPIGFTPFTPADGQGEPADGVAVVDTASEDARWTWVEAAAAAWMARREMDDPPADPVEAPPPPSDEPTAAP
ncbi:MAG: hypothetical protein QOF73_2913 [Thermomicrobiales bacterium]|nr:hypothetical protein [Thermomicrobiales bacterium]